MVERDLLEHRCTGARPRFLVVPLDQEPRLLFARVLLVQAHECKTALQSLSRQDEFQFTLAYPFVSIVERLPCAAIPGLDRAAAIFAGRYHALEFGIIYWMVLDM